MLKIDIGSCNNEIYNSKKCFKTEEMTTAYRSPLKCFQNFCILNSFWGTQSKSQFLVSKKFFLDLQQMLLELWQKKNAIKISVSGFQGILPRFATNVIGTMAKKNQSKLQFLVSKEFFQDFQQVLFELIT